MPITRTVRGDLLKSPAPPLIAFISLFIVSTPSYAQSADTTVDTVYVGVAHSPTTAGVMEMFLPSAGFAYAGDWKRGLLPNALRLTAIVGIVTTADVLANTCDGICNAWQVLFVASTVWSIVGAVKTANQHNALIQRSKVGMSLERSPSGGISWGLRLTV